MNKTSDYIDYDIALNTGKKLLADDKTCRIGFYIILSCNVGLRISDVLPLKFKDLTNCDTLNITETKTGKRRIITLNDTVKKNYNKLVSRLTLNGHIINNNDYIFISQKGSVYKSQSINVILKEVFRSKKLQISSHSLRKSFARRIYDNNNQSEASLILLGDILNHSSVSITRRYLGIRKETIENVYLSL